MLDQRIADDGEACSVTGTSPCYIYQNGSGDDDSSDDNSERLVMLLQSCRSTRSQYALLVRSFDYPIRTKERF